MGGGGTETTTQTTGLSNPAMDAAATTIGNQLNSALSSGVKPYTGSMVPAMSGQTLAGISGVSNNPFSSGYSDTIGSVLQQQGDIAKGNFGADPVRSRLMDDVSQNVNSSFLTDGRFGSMGSGAHSDTLARETAGAIAPYDMARQQQAIQSLPGLYDASMAPAMAQLQVGQLVDQYNTATAEDQARIFDATNNANWNTLQRGSAVFSGTAPVSGTTQTTTQPTAPWWQQALGAGAVGSGIYKNIWGR